MIFLDKLYASLDKAEQLVGYLDFTQIITAQILKRCFENYLLVDLIILWNVLRCIFMAKTNV